LMYSTYLGGRATDVAGGLAVDDAGNAYITGSTSSNDFPTTTGAFQTAVNGTACGPPPGTSCPDAFVTKLSTDGPAALYSTLLGGTEPEAAGGVAVDAEGRALLTGSTQSSDYPTRRPAQVTLANESCTADQPEELCSDGFVARFTDDGSTLDYSTYLGGEATDQGLGIAVDEGGNAYVVGRTDSRRFPALRPVQSALGGYIDGFITKLGARHGALGWSTFLGGTDADRITGVAVSGSQDVRVVGRTLSPDFRTKNPLQPSLRDDDFDAFVTNLQ
jgi:hypothetical protein